MTEAQLSPVIQNIRHQIIGDVIPIFTSPVRVEANGYELKENDRRALLKYEVAMAVSTSVLPAELRNHDFMEELRHRNVNYFRNLMYGDLEAMLYDMVSCYEMGDPHRARELFGRIRTFMGYQGR